MEDIRAQQLEALEMGIQYVQRLIPATREILPELRGEEKEDTAEFLDQILAGINFLIEIVNGTISLINEKEIILNKDGIEEKVQQLNVALQEKDNPKVAVALEEGMLPFMEIYLQVAAIIADKEKVQA